MKYIGFTIFLGVCVLLVVWILQVHALIYIHINGWG